MSKMYHIVPNSRVKATGSGYYYVAIVDDDGKPHPRGMKLKDRNCRYIYEHIAKMELHLGRYLDETKEQVDHKDGDKSNNALSNLKLTERGPHQRDHTYRGNQFWKKSPRNKPGCKKKAASYLKEAAQIAILRYLST